MSNPPVYRVDGLGPSDLLTSLTPYDRRLKVALDGDLSGRLSALNTVEYTPIIELKPGPSVSLIRDRVEGPGTVSIVNGEIEVDGTAGLTTLYTRRYGRYLPGLESITGQKARPLDINSGTYRWGYGNGSGNRVGIEIIDGAIKTFVESGGTRWYEQSRANWLDPLDGTGDTQVDIPDLSDATLRIKFIHYGGLSFLFYLAFGDRENGDREYLIDSSGPRSGDVTIEQTDLPIFSETDSKLYVGGRQFGVLGRYRPRYRVTSSGRVTKTGVGTSYVPVVSFRVKKQDRWRAVPVEVLKAIASSGTNGEVATFIDPDLTISGSALVDGDWSDIDEIDAEETALEINTTADAFTGGYRADSDLVTGGLGSNQGTPSQDTPDIELPRDVVVTLAVRADSGTTATFRTELKMREEH